MLSSGMVRRVALVGTDVSEERIASITLCVLRLLDTVNVIPSSPILVTLMREAISSSETSVLTRATWRHHHRRRHSSVTAMKTLNLT
jgi:hypothetical protein